MKRQILKNRPLKAWQGILVVLGLAAATFADSLIFRLLRPLTGEAAASALFWVAGVALAVWTMRRFVMAYSYELSGTALRVDCLYGRYRRPLEEVYRNAVVAVGPAEETRKRYPDARVTRAVRPGSDLPPYAVAHRRDGRVRLLILQPDEELREALLRVPRKK